MYKHIGKQTIKFENPPAITNTACIVSTKEGEGPLAEYFDKVEEDTLFGKKTWEQAESELVKQTIELLLGKANLKPDDIDYLLNGDLLNQSTGSTFGVRDLNIPYFGLFGACSTFGEALTLGSILIDGGFAKTVVSGASSHFCSAEKTFRFPLEFSSQRPKTSSWTVTGDGSVVLRDCGVGPKITHATTGKITDYGITDANNMGAAMAPAAYSTIKAHFQDLKITPDYYDSIITGDLGHYGFKLLIELLQKDGIDISKNGSDCGILIFDQATQDTLAGGSGCGCSATTFCGYLHKKMIDKTMNKILLVPTGALMNQVTVLQGESIPAIAHAVAIEN